MERPYPTLEVQHQSLVCDEPAPTYVKQVKDDNARKQIVISSWIPNDELLSSLMR